MSLIGRLLHRAIPHTRAGDNLIYFLQFLRAHERVPRNRLNFNDYLFSLKKSKTIDSALLGFISDKELVKLFVTAVVGGDYNVPTIAVLKNSADIHHFNFQPNCVVKPTHASGKVLFTGLNGEVNRQEILS